MAGAAVPNIAKVLARVVVDDLDKAIPLYQALSGAEEVQKFGHGPVKLASVGPFLLLRAEGAEGYTDRTATILVFDVAPVVRDIELAGGEIIEGPSAGPNGERLVARHPDGSVFEYIAVPNG
ncbi:VOC family protein [Amycolatopsis balhimycina DSM 5908]|uniref:VOC family protein n=1 Tax=Amycolatopsis balhimycina DSM 5908 TaxID=1081091 RepID=A0A428WSF4_AMYBA|nr:VOC family protein [Amycolatopsis balhimycina DSM 5908]